MIQIALSGFLFEDNYESQSISFDKFCRIAHVLGYDGVELRNTQINIYTPKTEREKILEVVKNNELRVTCITARNLPAALIERTDAYLRYLELCEDIECNLLKISGEIEWLRWAAEKAAERSIILGVNNHIGNPLETVIGTKNFFKQLNHPNVKLLFDPFHLMVNNENYIECIPEFIDNIINVLMQSARLASSYNKKDIITIKNKSWEKVLPDEEGAQDWRKIFTKLKICKYKGLITVIENNWPKDKREFVAKYCIDFIRKEFGI
jgi:sugar phosphate isomerase/epimerase